jgi:hypothetical protein
MRGDVDWQLGYNPFKIVREMHGRGGGLMQFYGGYESGIAGRLGYLAIRNSVYKIIYDFTKPEKPYNDLTNREKMMIAGFAGGLAAWITTPLTVVNIRTILDSQIKQEFRRNYGGVSKGLSTLGSGKFKGSTENILKHVLMNVTLTGPYDFFHEGLYIRFGDYQFVEPLALFCACFVSSIIVHPVDLARTRVMQLQENPEWNRFSNNTSMRNVFFNSIVHEKSRFALWAGFYTHFFSTLVYGFLTVGVTNGITDAIKRTKGLKEWQM